MLNYYDTISMTDFEGMPLEQYQPELVSEVATADSLVDYRPCRPTDFVGRVEIQKVMWNFFEAVRNLKSNTRIIAVTGESGFGKSSLVAKLAQRFKNKKWRNRFFLFPVDVRSARGTMFVAETLLLAIRATIVNGFIPKGPSPEITDASNILSSDSIKYYLDYLQRSRKVIILFFDQFEEIFTKDSLLPLFRVFKRFALDVHARQSNIILGFSWRTGISYYHNKQL